MAPTLTTAPPPDAARPDARTAVTAVGPPVIDRREVVGIDELAPLLDGRWVPYVNLDNAATTPALQSVLDAVTDLLPRYASVHRGTGYKYQCNHF